jgi:hypothetical protein
MKAIVITLALSFAIASVNAQQMNHSSMKNENNKASDLTKLVKKP